MSRTSARAAEALVQYETSGMCLPGKKCQACDCGVENMDRDDLAEDLRRNQDRARTVLSAALDRDEIARVLHDRVCPDLTCERQAMGAYYGDADALIEYLTKED